MGKSGNGLVVDTNCACSRLDLSQKCCQKGRLARAIGTDDGDQLASENLKVDAFQNLLAAALGGQILNMKPGFAKYLISD